jgi:hypothetical protein
MNGVRLPQPLDRTIDRRVWVIARRANAQKTIARHINRHRARHPFAWPAALRAAKLQANVADAIRVDHLRERREEAILGVRAGLPADRILSENLYAHFWTSLCSGGVG